MKKVFLLLPVLLLYNLVGVVLLTRDVKTAETVEIQPLKMDNYLTDKGAVGDTPEFTFGDLYEYDPRMVLGATTPSVTTKKSSASVDLKKDNYTIAVWGDSMVDTLGTELSDLRLALEDTYSGVKFTLHNFGVASEDIEKGISRLSNSYTYLGVQKPSLLSVKPDVVVIDSFAYNHWSDSQSDIDRHWLAIARAIDVIKRYDPNIKIVLSATIAPYCPTYTDGSANLPAERKYSQCETVKKYLDNIYRFATSQNYPLANAFHESILGDGNGAPIFINQTDHIHPSEKGRTLIAKEIVRAIQEVL